jgi:hypothetical protein
LIKIILIATEFNRNYTQQQLQKMKFSVHAVAAFLVASKNVEAFSTSYRLSGIQQQQQQQQRQQSRQHSAGYSGIKQPLFGILDEVMGDDYNLMGSEVLGSDDSGMNNEQVAAYEIFLGDLVFSTNDPRLDIVENYEQATDPLFMDWMEQKAANSNDPEERMALRDLFDMIKDIIRKQEVNRLTQERQEKEAAVAEEERFAIADAEAEAGMQLSNAGKKRKSGFMFYSFFLIQILL